MTDSTVSAPSFPPGRQLSVFQIFHILKTGGLEKNLMPEGLKNSCHRYLLWGTYSILSKKTLLKNMALRARFQMLILDFFSQTVT